MKPLPPCRLKDKERVPVRCDTCGLEFTVSYAQIKKRGPDYKWHCRRCTMNNMSDEDKARRSDKIKDALGNKTAEEKASMTAKRMETISTPEFKKMLREKIQQCWENKSEEELKRISNRASENTQRIWNTMNSEEKERRVSLWNNGAKEWRESLTDEEKEILRQQNSQRLKEYWAKVSEEKRIKHGQKSRDWYNTLTPEEKKLYIHKRISPSANHNKLSEKFESYLHYYHIKFEAEYEISCNGNKHIWDYLLYSDNKPNILVDLDGVFYHADNCDYDGVHSREDYDMIRGLTVPDGIKWAFIQEKDFDNGFEYIIDIMNLSYDEFIQKRFNEYRTIPFPSPNYTNLDLLRSYNQLIALNPNDPYYRCMNVYTRIGNMIVSHFHQSLFTPLLKYWNDDTALKDLISKHILIHSYLNKNKILQGFKLIDTSLSFISPGLAKMIINKYLNEFDEIFNPCNHYSEILLAAVSMNKRYVGIETDEVRRNEIGKMIEFLNKYGIKFNVSILTDDNEFHDCIFTWVDSDEEIETYLNHYQCNTYIFATGNDTKFEHDEVTNFKIIKVKKEVNR